MATVVVPLKIGPIQDRMRDMRTWLDAKSIQPALFRYDIRKGTALIEIGFAERRHAEAFAVEFAGKLT